MVDSLPIHKLVDSIISVLDARDPYTYEHSERVAFLSELIAKKMKLDQKMVELIHIAAHLHDIGKVGIPDYVLNKKGALTDSEFALMKSHPRIGYNIINNIDLLKETSLCILYHHERWDGEGYPCRLEGKEIPLGARIIAIADSFDAMTTQRSYRNQMTIEEACCEIKRVRGTQLSPDVVDSFLTLKDSLPDILKDLNLKIHHHVFNNEEKSFLCRASL